MYYFSIQNYIIATGNHPIAKGNHPELGGIVHDWAESTNQGNVYGGNRLVTPYCCTLLLLTSQRQACIGHRKLILACKPT